MADPLVIDAGFRRRWDHGIAACGHRYDPEQVGCWLCEGCEDAYLELLEREHEQDAYEREVGVA